jgi:hypothetical protein
MVAFSRATFKSVAMTDAADAFFLISDLAVPHPAAVVLPAVGNLLEAGGVPFGRLDGPDQVALLHLRIIFHPENLGLFLYLLGGHGVISSCSYFKSQNAAIVKLALHQTTIFSPGI